MSGSEVSLWDAPHMIEHGIFILRGLFMGKSDKGVLRSDTGLKTLYSLTKTVLWDQESWDTKTSQTLEKIILNYTGEKREHFPLLCMENKRYKSAIKNHDQRDSQKVERRQIWDADTGPGMSQPLLCLSSCLLWWAQNMLLLSVPLPTFSTTKRRLRDRCGDTHLL